MMKPRLKLDPRLLRSRRAYLDIPQHEAGRLLGVAQTTISDWETGRTQPNADALAGLAQVYGCDIRDFFAVVGEENAAA